MYQKTIKLKVLDSEVNMLSEKRRDELDNEFAKVFGADFVKSVNKLPEERTWCCWVLSESEVLKAIKDVGVPESYGIAVSEENRERFIKDVVDKFKGALSIMAEEWGYELKVCVTDVIDDWKGGE